MRALNDPRLVRDEYASEERLLVRRSLWDAAEGPDARDAVVAAVAEIAPRRVLEVGCGPGDLAERIVRELAVELVAVDLSPRMVELARARGVDARVGDVQALPFPDESFDCVVAAWMLYHVPDLDGGLGEIARVLRPGGRLVAATNSERNLAELWALIGREVPTAYTFSRENGGEPLGRRFARVERRDVEGWVSFADREAAHRHVAASVMCGDRADALPLDGWPLRARRSMSIFVAETA